ncbi:L,D-transpeptidase [Ancylobacter sp. VNQ12]|uniref:L,D-transpeptidase n=1 Tax=Ancylobacter sp. VNQ12 TaxID=3400920 RepID=UPI003C05F7BA
MSGLRAVLACATSVRLACAGIALMLLALPASARTQGVVGATTPAPSVVTAAVGAPSAFAGAPATSLVVHIDLSGQRMEVWVDGWRRYSWPISTARKGYRTPVGSFRPYRMHRRYFSRKYDNAPMPHAIFFTGGYAIHGTTDLRRLGRPASHGCVRLHPANAAALFALVNEAGRGNTQIVITR